MKIDLVGDTITADDDVVALLNREPKDSALQTRFEDRLRDLTVDELSREDLLDELETVLLERKQAGWVRVSDVVETLRRYKESK
jgi:hypothetical protein